MSVSATKLFETTLPSLENSSDHLHLSVLEGGHAQRSRFVKGLEPGEGEAVHLLQAGLAACEGRALDWSTEGELRA